MRRQSAGVDAQARDVEELRPGKHQGPTTLPGGLRFLTPQTLPLLFDFPKDMERVPAEVNRLSNQVLVTTYEQEWGKVLP